MSAIAVVHNYQTPEIFHCVADYTGDSLGLAKFAARTPAETIVQYGVYFMAETSKILCPEKTVLIPDASAGCSLIEAIVMAERTASRIDANTGLDLTYVADVANGERGISTSEGSRHWQTLRATMSQKVGIVRTSDGLSQAVSEIEGIQSNVDSLRRRTGRSRSLAELENGVTVALLTARAANARQESVGCHYVASSQ